MSKTEAIKPIFDIECVGFEPASRGGLIGFASVRVKNWGVTLHGISIFRSKDGRAGASIPGRAILDAERNLVRRPDGRPRYAEIVEFDSKEAQAALERAVLQAVYRYRTTQAKRDAEPKAGAESETAQ